MIRVEWGPAKPEASRADMHDETACRAMLWTCRGAQTGADLVRTAGSIEVRKGEGREASGNVWRRAMARKQGRTEAIRICPLWMRQMSWRPRAAMGLGERWGEGQWERLSFSYLRRETSVDYLEPVSFSKR